MTGMEARRHRRMVERRLGRIGLAMEEKDIDLIRCIPLSPSSVEDAWFWMLETHRDYLVKSAYRALQDM
ncbi:hypothetical protein F8388_009003 [Cannabis sativa]|uniref:Uncharacterized protein n=1 Tax=Cannabis sativa TaxID=3483 RepID=A0A7J6GJD4_CANSA|nr:hypothetical protein F8388_009003 [Cannabis sativa]